MFFILTKNLVFNYLSIPEIRNNFVSIRNVDIRNSHLVRKIHLKAYAYGYIIKTNNFTVL